MFLKLVSFKGMFNKKFSDVPQNGPYHRVKGMQFVCLEGTDKQKRGTSQLLVFTPNNSEYLIREF